jgi:divalent metal cation (Fe/Co/Zn/Cd) transporter
VEAFPQGDVTVTANPVALDSETVFQKVMLIASRRNLAVHHVTVQQIGGQLAVSFDLEVEGDVALAEAHDTATKLESAIRRELGSDVEVETHIEPQPERLLAGEDAPEAERNEIIRVLTDLAGAQPRMSDVHNIRIRTTGDGLFVHYHCRFDGRDSIDKVHTTIDHVENELQAKFPEIRRVIAHAEPVGYGKHAL